MMWLSLLLWFYNDYDYILLFFSSFDFINYPNWISSIWIFFLNINITTLWRKQRIEHTDLFREENSITKKNIKFRPQKNMREIPALFHRLVQEKDSFPWFLKHHEPDQTKNIAPAITGHQFLITVNISNNINYFILQTNMQVIILWPSYLWLRNAPLI